MWPIPPASDASIINYRYSHHLVDLVTLSRNPGNWVRYILAYCRNKSIFTFSKQFVVFVKFLAVQFLGVHTDLYMSKKQLKIMKVRFDCRYAAMLRCVVRCRVLRSAAVSGCQVLCELL
jgi:hypothetical protein